MNERSITKSFLINSNNFNEMWVMKRKKNRRFSPYLALQYLNNPWYLKYNPTPDAHRTPTPPPDDRRTSTPPPDDRRNLPSPDDRRDPTPIKFSIGTMARTPPDQYLQTVWPENEPYSSASNDGRILVNVTSGTQTDNNDSLSNSLNPLPPETVNTSPSNNSPPSNNGSSLNDSSSSPLSTSLETTNTTLSESSRASKNGGDDSLLDDNSKGSSSESSSDDESGVVESDKEEEYVLDATDDWKPLLDKEEIVAQIKDLSVQKIEGMETTLDKVVVWYKNDEDGRPWFIPALVWKTMRITLEEDEINLLKSDPLLFFVYMARDTSEKTKTFANIAYSINKHYTVDPSEYERLWMPFYNIAEDTNIIQYLENVCLLSKGEDGTFWFYLLEDLQKRGAKSFIEVIVSRENKIFIEYEEDFETVTDKKDLAEKLSYFIDEFSAPFSIIRKGKIIKFGEPQVYHLRQNRESTPTRVERLQTFNDVLKSKKLNVTDIKEPWKSFYYHKINLSK